MPGTIDLTSRCALVTGAARGIGKAAAIALAEAGASVAVNYRERAEAAEGVVAAIRGLGRKAIPVQADVSDAAAVAGMIVAVARELGPVDVLVNNAGVAPHRGLDELTRPIST
jgi:3-oxoacyl-[acyl-carrier protein] reductase